MECPTRTPRIRRSRAGSTTNAAITDSVTLLDFLRHRVFQFCLLGKLHDVRKEYDEARLPPPFSYPYGDNHGWPAKVNGADDLRHYPEQFESTKSPVQFWPAHR
jgi:hypothetical protein